MLRSQERLLSAFPTHPVTIRCPVCGGRSICGWYLPDGKLGTGNPQAQNNQKANCCFSHLSISRLSERRSLFSLRGPPASSVPSRLGKRRFGRASRVRTPVLRAGSACRRSHSGAGPARRASLSPGTLPVPAGSE